MLSPTFTGTVAGMTKAMVGLQQMLTIHQMLTSRFLLKLKQHWTLKASIASPTFTGTPTLPTGAIAVTQTAGNSSTSIATTAFVGDAVSTATSAAVADALTMELQQLHHHKMLFLMHWL